MGDGWPHRVAILYEGQGYGGDFGLSFAAGLRAHGCEVTFVPRAEPWGDGIDLLLACGPFDRAGSMLPVGRRLAALGRHARPAFAWWLTEGIPDRRLPPWLAGWLASARLAADRRLGDGRPAAAGARSLASILERGHRLRVFGELRWFQRRGLLDVLAVTSESRARFLRQDGFRPVTVPLGYHAAAFGEDLGLARDVPVCFLGQPGSVRRRRLLERVTRDLADAGVGVLAVEVLYGDERTRLLNRTTVLLNVLRAPQDFVGQRFVLGAANGALVVSEPIADPLPFVPGHHLVVAPVARLAATVLACLGDEPLRRRITDEAHRFVTTELTAERMVGRVLEHARQAARSGRSAPAAVPAAPGAEA